MKKGGGWGLPAWTAGGYRKAAKPPRAILIHLAVGREGTHCGRGIASPAFHTRERLKVTCPRCQRAR